MRIFLVGGTGFIGRGVLPKLLKEGFEVVALVRERSLNKLIPREHPRLRVILGDLFRPKTYYNLEENFYALVNLVGILRERRGATFRDLHVKAVELLVNFAKDKGIERFIHISANGVRPDGVPYQRSKWEGEEIIRKSGLLFTILRPSIVLGDDKETFNFNGLLDLLLIFPIIPLPGGGNFLFQPVSRDRVAECVVEALKDPKGTSKIHHLCGDRVVTFKEMLKERKGKRKRLFINFPMSLFRFFVSILGRIPLFPLTVDQLKMMEQGNICPEEK
jgi:NADH dehydrogenase